MTVTPIEGEIFRFHATSESVLGQAYLVDLQENDYSGRCGCRHFECRLQPLFDSGSRGRDVACKHIRACKELWFEFVARKIGEAMDKR